MTQRQPTTWMAGGLVVVLAACGGGAPAPATARTTSAEVPASAAPPSGAFTGEAPRPLPPWARLKGESRTLGTTQAPTRGGASAEEAPLPSPGAMVPGAAGSREETSGATPEKETR